MAQGEDECKKNRLWWGRIITKEKHKTSHRKPSSRGFQMNPLACYKHGATFWPMCSPIVFCWLHVQEACAATRVAGRVWFGSHFNSMWNSLICTSSNTMQNETQLSAGIQTSPDLGGYSAPAPPVQKSALHELLPSSLASVFSESWAQSPPGQTGWSRPCCRQPKPTWLLSTGSMAAQQPITPQWKMWWSWH